MWERKVHGLRNDSNEDECVDDAEVLVYEGPIGKIGAEPLFDAPRPTWYYCETMGF